MEFGEFIKVCDIFSNNIVFSDKARFELCGNIHTNDNSWTLSTHISKSILIKRIKFHYSILNKSRCL